MPLSDKTEQNYAEIQYNYELHYGPIFESTLNREAYNQLEMYGTFEIEVTDFIKKFVDYTVYYIRPIEDYLA